MEMLSGLPPFYEHRTESNYNRILHESLSFKSFISREARSIALDLLEKKPADRLAVASEVKKHEFFDPTDWEGVENMTTEIPFDVGFFSSDEEESSDSSSVKRISEYYET